jgi:hypothetical protein
MEFELKDLFFRLFVLFGSSSTRLPEWEASAFALELAGISS